MATHQTSEERLEIFMATMGPTFGHAFHRLDDDLSTLHLKWNEFLTLFVNGGPAQIRDLNTAAPGFFSQVGELWWDDLLLHICRMTEKREDVLSVYTLLAGAPPQLKDIIESHIALARPATEFARQVRHKTIAHRDRKIALGVTTLSRGSRNDIRGALKALDDLLHAVRSYYFQTSPTVYDYLDNIGGAKSLLEIIDRGLKSRDAQYGYFRHPHPADPPDGESE